MVDRGLSFRDTEELLIRIGDAAEHIVVVGGQAVNFWAGFYEDRVEELRAAAPFTSKDVDVCGGSQELELVARKLGGTGRLAGFDDQPPQVGTITFKDSHGETRVIDVMTNLTGVTHEDIVSTSVRIDYERDTGAPLVFQVMHPVLVLESRAHNVVASEKYRGAHGIGQLRASVHCAREFLNDLIVTDPKKTLKWNERIFGFSLGDVAKCVAATYAIETFDALARGPGLAPLFYSKRYPQMCARVDRARRGAKKA